MNQLNQDGAGRLDSRIKRLADVRTPAGIYEVEDKDGNTYITNERTGELWTLEQWKRRQRKRGGHISENGTVRTGTR